MKVVIYSRVSTETQTVAQQERTVNEWLRAHGLVATHEIAEEGVSGKVSYKNRNLGKKVLPLLEVGDILIVSEISRLGRSMSDINKFINDELKPRGVRLVVVQMGIDLNTANMKAIDEMLLFAFSFGAQLERELIQERTQSAIEVRKRKISEEGGFVSKKSGRFVTKLGRPKREMPSEEVAAYKRGYAASAANRREAAASKPCNRAIWEVVKKCTNDFADTSADRFEEAAGILRAMGVRSSSGKELTMPLVRSAYYNLRSVMTDYRYVRKDSVSYKKMISNNNNL